jgi:hypothetical protein
MGNTLTATPIVKEHQGVLVVRDDLFPGGTKARFIPALFNRADEVVYASSAEGGAQSPLAFVAQALGKRATIFVPDRKIPHPRQLEARRLGASVETIRPGHRTVVEARAREYCKKSRALLAPFGMRVPGCIEVIAEAARQVDCKPSEVWCVAGSGTLATALRRAWPDAEHHVVQVGHKLTSADVAGVNIHEYPGPYGRALPATATPFPSDPHYDAKAWEICLAKCASNKTVVFWNVMGPAQQ